MFLINLMPMHVLALMLTGRFSHRVYIAYSTVRILANLLCKVTSLPIGVLPGHHIVNANSICWFSTGPVQ